MLSQEELKEIVDIGIELTAEKDEDVLLDKILITAMKVAHCDAGTLYLSQKGELVYKITKTISKNIHKGLNGEKIDLEPVQMREENVCAYAAIHHLLVNVSDVYTDRKFDFKRVKRNDSLINYHTKSMLVMPMMNSDDKVVGILQLMNAMDDWGNVISFDEDQVYVVRTLASQAAVSISNMLYIQEIKDQMYSFIDAFSTVSDARTPYNGTHTKKVTKYAALLADEINRRHEEGTCRDYFDENRREQLILAASVHDIGKLVVPLSIMNKATRLEGCIEDIKNRFALIQAYYEIDYLKGVISMSEYELERRFLEESLETIKEINVATSVTKEQMEQVHKIACHTYHRAGDVRIPYLTPSEKSCLEIVRGTLTIEERKEMENHVHMTNTILSKVKFNSHFSNVRKFAASHHELMDGSGYPNHLRGEALDLETRILAIVDIFDALTSKDRPYKRPVSKEKAFDILYDMAKKGKLEARLVEYLEAAL